MAEGGEKNLMEEQKKGVDNFKLKLGLFVLLVLSMGAITILHYTTEISLKIPIIISIIVFIIFVIVLFFKKLTSLFGKTDKKETPDPIDIKEVEKIRDNEIKKLWNNKKIDGTIELKTRDINKNLIYAYRVPLQLDQEFYDDESKEWKNYYSCWIIINSTYPKIGATTTHGEISDEKVSELMNEKSLDPKDTPGKKITVLSNDITGTTRTVEEPVQQEKEKEEEIA